VADVTPSYARSNAVVVPVRAGGGTRIKTLEAFAHCRAVVATPKGVEGLSIRPGEHALVADSAEGLAACLARLIDSPATAAGLADRGYRFVKAQHDPAVLERILRPDLPGR
jgi:glycosyltransferase involved in cell wall biosynthesis